MILKLSFNREKEFFRPKVACTSSIFSMVMFIGNPFAPFRGIRNSMLQEQQQGEFCRSIQSFEEWFGFFLFGFTGTVDKGVLETFDCW
jgi:hypothetical protein